MGVVGAVLNADSVDSTAGDKGCGSSTECGVLRYYCSMGVVRAVLNEDSVDTTAGNKLWEQY